MPMSMLQHERGQTQSTQKRVRHAALADLT
jgi:hypothetical protein